MDINTILEDLGLQDKEPDVYLELVKLPGSHPASVIARRLNLNRTTTYKTLLNLAKKGLVSKSLRKGVTCFFGENPEEKLNKMVKNEKKKLDDINKVIKKSLPFLMMDKEKIAIPDIRYYEGNEGVKIIYDLIIKTGKDVYYYGDIKQIYQALGDFTDEFIQERLRNGITTRAIMSFEKEEDLKYKINEKENRKVLYIPNKIFPIKGEIRIFGDYVALISYQKKHLISVLIKNQIIAKMFLSIFMLTWDKEKGM